MNTPAVQQPLFRELAADLPDQHKAEFFRNLHEAGISPNDVELARLLRALQLYKAYYESIPATVKEAAAEINRLKQEIERLCNDTRRSSDAGAQLVGQVVQEAERFRQDLSEIHEHVVEAMRHSTGSLATHMAEELRAGIEGTVLLPLQNRLAELAKSNQGFDDAIARSNQAAIALHRNAALARRVHLGGYALGGLLIVFSLILVSWFYLHQWYLGRIEQERAVLVGQIDQNRTVLLQLAKSHRTLELLQDPKNPRRKLLVMKEASGWQSTRNHGVIEFYE
jgi:hypothetical protein